MRACDGVGCDNSRCSADRRSGSDQFGKLAFDTEHAAEPFGEDEGCNQREEGSPATPFPPTSITCVAVNCSPSRMMAKRNILRTENVTPALARLRRADKIVKTHADDN